MSAGRSPTLALVRLLVASVFGFTDGKRDFKTITKTIGIGLAIIAGSANIVLFLVFIDLAMYEAFKPLGLHYLMILMSIVAASLLILVLGFISTVSTYAMNNHEVYLLALPLKPWQLLSGKFAVSYLMQLPLALLVMGPALAIWIIREGPGFLFYPYALLLLAALPLLPTALSYLIVVPVMRFGNAIKNKAMLQGLAIFIGIAVLMAFNIGFQTLARNEFTMGTQAASLLDSPVLTAMRAWWPAELGSAALANNTTLLSLLGILGFVALNAGLAVGVVALLGKPYAKSLPAFLEIAVKKLKDAKGFILNRARSTPLLLTLLLRELRLMNREPTFFFNGPFVLLLMPLVFIIVSIIPMSGSGANFSAIASIPGITGLVPLISMAGAIFLSSTTLIAQTAWSREGKAINLLKAMPIDPSQLALAKFLHAQIFNFIACLIPAVGFGLALKADFGLMLLSYFSSLTYTSFLLLLGLLVDTAIPRLAWDNPLKALKNNPNTILVMFGGLTLSAIFAVPILFIPNQVLQILTPGLIGIVGLASLWVPYQRFLRARYASWEP